MKIQERLNVSPYVFYGFALVFWDDLYSQGEPCVFTDLHNITAIVPDITPLWAQLSINNKETAKITVVTTLPGKSRLTLEVEDGNWSTIQPWWERFKAELIQEELISDEDLTSQQPQSGRSELSPEETVYRLTKALEVRAHQERTPKPTWRELVGLVKWDRGGTRQSSEKLLQNACAELSR